MHNQAVEHNVAMLSELSVAICWQGRVTTSSQANQMSS